ncbi:MAG: glycosyltransferase family 39 protein [Candidatus Omnitrophica bacterium]|nr:glycosyltransferase family 39 protein [Candidatus Omnitrophota bacterium]
MLKIFGRTKLVVLSLFVVNLAMGFLLINEGLFHQDAVILAKAVENTYANGRLQPAVRGRYGCVLINSILYFPFYKLGQNADFATRFSSVLFHALSIAAFFLFIYEYFGNRVQALFGALLLSVTPFYFSPNTYGKEHGMSIFFFLTALYLLRRSLRKNNILLLSVSSFVLGFAVSVRESIIIAAPLYFLLYLDPQICLKPPGIRLPDGRLRLKYLCALLLPFALTFLFLYLSYLKPAIYRELLIHDDTTISFMGISSPYLRLAFGDLYKSVSSLLFLFAALGAMQLLMKEKIFPVLLSFSWFLLILYFGNLDMYAPRFLDIVILPVHILASYALAKLYSKDKAVAAIIVVYLVSSMFISMYPSLKFRHSYNGEKKFALFVKDKTEPNAIIVTMDDALFIEYYAGRKTLTHPINNWKEMHPFLRQFTAAWSLENSRRPI